MKMITSRWALTAVMLPLMAGGCASSAAPGATAGHAGHVATPVAAATPVPAPSATATTTSLHELPAPSAREVESGIQIAQIGLTAQGGMVDVRFKVLDAAKAKALLGNPANTPVLIAGDQPPLHPPHHALKGARFARGQVFYILYPNARGAVKPGVEVTVAMGDARLGPVKAQ
ncbi:MAG: hypothetical protein ABI880_06680 [Acidobacteriota bacterium]